MHLLKRAAAPTGGAQVRPSGRNLDISVALTGDVIVFYYSRKCFYYFLQCGVFFLIHELFPVEFNLHRQNNINVKLFNITHMDINIV